MYFFVTAAWIAVKAISYVQGNQVIPITVGILGFLAQIGIWTPGIGYFGISALALLTAIGLFSVPEIFFRR
jgi:hypothetical protein